MSEQGKIVYGDYVELTSKEMENTEFCDIRDIIAEHFQKKQIEEMAREIYENTKLSVVEIAEDIANYLYNAGYRKERQGEWVSIYTRNGKKVCSNCKYPQPYKKIKVGYHLLDNVKYCPNCGCKIIYKGER